MNNTYKRLLEMRNKELNWYLEDGQNKEKYNHEQRLQHILNMQEKRKSYDELFTIIENDIFDSRTIFRDLDETVQDIENEIVEVREIISEDFLDIKKYFEVEFDDFFVEILEDEIIKFGLTKEDIFKIAIVIAINHYEEN